MAWKRRKGEPVEGSEGSDLIQFDSRLSFDQANYVFFRILSKMLLVKEINKTSREFQGDVRGNINFDFQIQSDGNNIADREGK